MLYDSRRAIPDGKCSLLLTIVFNMSGLLKYFRGSFLLYLYSTKPYVIFFDRISVGLMKLLVA